MKKYYWEYRLRHDPDVHTTTIFDMEEETANNMVDVVCSCIKDDTPFYIRANSMILRGSDLSMVNLVEAIT